MALEGTFADPIEPFTALSSRVNRLLCEEYRDERDFGYWDSTKEEEIIQKTNFSDAKNDRDIGILNEYGFEKWEGSYEYPLSGDDWLSYDGIEIFGYTKKQAVEFFYGLKSIKISFTSDWNVNWLQTTQDDLRGNGDTDLANPLTTPCPFSTSGTIEYHNLKIPQYAYDPNVFDWIVPTERVCGFSYYMSMRLREQYGAWLDSYNTKSVQQGWRENWWHSGNQPCVFQRAGENDYKITFHQYFFPFFQLYDQTIGIGYAEQTVAGRTPARAIYWTPESNSFHKATFRYIDAKQNKDISGELFYRFWGYFDLRATSANIHIDIEVEYWDFQR